MSSLSKSDKQRINAVVAEAETKTGLEVCVVVGKDHPEDVRREAERMFHKLGLHARPAVLVLVTPSKRTLEVVTAYDIGGRLSNADCDEAVRLMTGLFATNDIVGGIERGVQFLAERAGDSPVAVPEDDVVPNVVDLDD